MALRGQSPAARPPRHARVRIPNDSTAFSQIDYIHGLLYYGAAYGSSDDALPNSARLERGHPAETRAVSLGLDAPLCQDSK